MNAPLPYSVSDRSSPCFLPCRTFGDCATPLRPAPAIININRPRPSSNKGLTRRCAPHLPAASLHTLYYAFRRPLTSGLPLSLAFFLAYALFVLSPCCPLFASLHAPVLPPVDHRLPLVPSPLGGLVSAPQLSSSPANPPTVCPPLPPASVLIFRLPSLATASPAIHPPFGRILLQLLCVLALAYLPSWGCYCPSPGGCCRCSFDRLPERITFYALGSVGCSRLPAVGLRAFSLTSWESLGSSSGRCLFAALSPLSSVPTLLQDVCAAWVALTVLRCVAVPVGGLWGGGRGAPCAWVAGVALFGLL